MFLSQCTAQCKSKAADTRHTSLLLRTPAIGTPAVVSVNCSAVHSPRYTNSYLQIVTNDQ